MTSTDKVLSIIGALNTLIENFPMSILDLFRGKTYTSVFEFIVDVLYACGVDTNEIIEYLLNLLYSVTPSIEGGLENLHEKIANADFTQVQQSKTLQGIEYSIKGILMTLLTSLYGCSAIPVLPNKVMDYPDNKNAFSGNVNTALWEESIYPISLKIPVKLIDPMGILQITPTTPEGRAYYEIDGKDVYYRKIKNTNPLFSTSFNTALNNAIFITEKTIDNNVYLTFNSFNELPEDILITVGYFKKDVGQILKWKSTIKINELKANDSLLIKNGTNKIIYGIEWIKINNKNGSCNLLGDVSCYLSNKLSENVIKRHNIFNNVIWGDNNENVLLGETSENSEYIYQIIEKPSKEERKKAIRKSVLPNNASKDDEDIIIVYQGIDPNSLYKTFDMNAFIWYTLVKSNRANQLSINHTMWDNRLPALKHGFYRNEKEWNKWYDSKKSAIDEFKNYKGNEYHRITKDDSIYPILQLKKSAYNLYGIDVTFPSQRYFKTKYREKILSGKIPEIGPTLRFNSSIYRFNWEYLNSIQILQPKLMLTGFVDYMLGFALNAHSSFNLTIKKIESKLTTVVKNVIEADDMQVEDCYTSFSNENFDDMLEEMMLSRYNATYYGGENNKVKKHDTDYYLSLIDSFNSSATKEESVQKITKIIEEITASPGTEGGVKIGFEADYKNLLQKLIWALTMPIIQSLFTPQVMLLLAINMNLTGVFKMDNLFQENDINLVDEMVDFIFNKVMGLLKSIVKFIKDIIIELLLKLLITKLTPLLLKYMGALNMERLEYWLNILMAAIACLPKFMFLDIKRYKRNLSNSIDNVDYADIINTGQTSTPEATQC